MRFLFRNILLFSLALTTPSLLFSQATATGNITGAVTDATGAALPNATVTATNTATNAQRTTTSGVGGQYRFDLLPGGVYTIKSDAPGFSPTEAKGIELLVGTTVTANLPMKTGTVSTSVEVTAANHLLDTEKTASSSAA